MTLWGPKPQRVNLLRVCDPGSQTSQGMQPVESLITLWSQTTLFNRFANALKGIVLQKLMGNLTLLIKGYF